MAQRIYVAWSGGKDCALSYHQLAGDRRYEIAGILTTVTGDYDRISMHGVRTALLGAQAAELGVPLAKVVIDAGADNDQYESKMRRLLLELRAQGVSAVAFGDIFLEDLRAHREAKLAEVGMAGLFPLWKQDTRALAGRFLDAGFGAILTCVDGRCLDGRFAGRAYDRALLDELPPQVDPCGENGEFHSFVHAGPIFRRPIGVRRGQTVLRDERFWFCDLLADDGSA